MTDGVVEFGQLDEKAMKSLAQSIGKTVSPGNVILLHGQVGAGKTTFARALVSSILLEPEDIPSPTFTLVQTYDTSRGPLWHCDLYRIGSTSEIEELGLLEAFETAICLVEWPDILGDMTPESALSLTFEGSGDNRVLAASFTDLLWSTLPLA